MALHAAVARSGPPLSSSGGSTSLGPPPPVVGPGPWLPRPGSGWPGSGAPRSMAPVQLDRDRANPVDVRVLRGAIGCPFAREEAKWHLIHSDSWGALLGEMSAERQM